MKKIFLYRKKNFLLLFYGRRSAYKNWKKKITSKCENIRLKRRIRLRGRYYSNEYKRVKRIQYKLIYLQRRWIPNLFKKYYAATRIYK